VSLSLESILRRQPGADDSALNGEVVVLDAEGRMVRALNGTAARVWQLLDGQRTVRDICKTIALEFDAGTEAIEADVISFLNYLCRVQLAVGGA
jgi:pyrroloquinoline quinone biosynthesis protein D